MLFSICFVWGVFLFFYMGRLNMHEISTSEAQYLPEVKNAVKMVNNEWLLKRAHLLRLYASFKGHQPIGSYQMNWVWENIAKHSDVFNPYSENQWRTLEERVDVVPVNVVLNEAAKESHNGTTLLAQQGNNYFNIVISKPEFGIATTLMEPSKKALNWLAPNDIQYAKYYSNEIALIDYIWMLNSLDQFQHFRALRAKLRAQHLPVQTASSKSLEASLSGVYLATDSLYGRGFTPIELPALTAD